jgi:ribosomal protein S1
LAAQVRKSIVPGAVLDGRVASVVDFGAFIDFGGDVQGLLHLSDMSWSRVDRPQAVVAVGDSITVKVLGVNEDRISLGLKQLEDDPWKSAASRYGVGQVHTGRITRVVDFGAFVELEPGIEALAHASTFPSDGRPRGWADSVSAGTTAHFEILSIEPERKRMSVAIVEDRTALDELRTERQVDDGPSFGSLADKLRDALGDR